jgi:hypothetical protein
MLYPSVALALKYRDLYRIVFVDPFPPGRMPVSLPVLRFLKLKRPAT